MSFSRKLWFFALAAAVALPAAKANGGVETPLGLREALAKAMERNFDIRVERVVFDGTERVLEGSYGAYDPLLTADWTSAVDRQNATSVLQSSAASNLSMNRSDSYNVGLSQATPWAQSFSLKWENDRLRSNSRWALFNPSYTSSLKLGTTLPLLQGAGRTPGNKTVLLARIDRSIAGHQFEAQVRDTLAQVENSYWDLVFAIKDLIVKERSLELAKRFQEETRLKIQVGVLAPIEQIAADATVAEREEEIIAAQTAVGNLEEVLKLSMGLTQESPEWSLRYVPADEPREAARPEAAVEALVSGAIAARPEVKELEAKLERERLNSRLAKNALLPRLDLAAGLSYQGSSGDYFLIAGERINEDFPDAWSQIRGRDYKSWYAGLTFRYPIGNRAAKAAYHGAVLTRTSAEILLAKRREVVANEVRAALRNLDGANKRVAAAEVTRRLQEQKLDAEEKKFRNGLSTSFQVLSYQNDLTRAESLLLLARIDRQRSSAALDRALGTYLEARGFRLETSPSEMPSRADSRIPSA